jgi:predicted enzyme related to lactoylglutathione lyase
MIRGLHGMFQTSKADEARAFMRDKLRLPFTDVGGGWLIFDLPEADVGFHPAEGADAGKHDVSFYCDDIRGTMAELRKRGVEFTQDAKDHGYGWVTYFEMPGGIEVQLYEPKYQKGAAKRAAKTAKRKKPAARKPAAAKRKPAAKTKAKPAKRKKARR